MDCKVQCEWCNSDCANLDKKKKNIVEEMFLSIGICSHCGAYGDLGKKCSRGANCPEGVYL